MKLTDYTYTCHSLTNFELIYKYQKWKLRKSGGILWQKFVLWHRETEFIFGRFLTIWDHCATKGCCTGKLWRRSSGSWQSSLYKQQRRQHQDQVVQRLRPREVQGGEGGLGREGRKALRTITAVLCVYSEHTHTSTTRFLLLLRPLWLIFEKK